MRRGISYATRAIELRDVSEAQKRYIHNATEKAAAIRSPVFRRSLKAQYGQGRFQILKRPTRYKRLYGIKHLLFKEWYWVTMTQLL